MLEGLTPDFESRKKDREGSAIEKIRISKILRN
jgi:hypothetical protein